MRSATYKILIVALAAAPALARAQDGKSSGPEFTKQGLLIVNFIPSPGTDMKTGVRAGDAVRDRVAKLVDKREVVVIDGGDIRDDLEKAGYSADTIYSMSDIHAIGNFLRADEYVSAHVANGPNGVHMFGQIVLLRDERLHQKLPDVSAPRLDSAATLFARGIATARLQFVHQRRCENALREGNAQRAIAAAKAGIATFDKSTVARTCLLWAVRQAKSPFTEVLQVSRDLLALDSVNVHALEGAAVSLDSLHRRPEAADMWLRLAATDTANLELALRVSFALFDGGNSKRAEPFIVALSNAHPDDIHLLQQKWRITYENKSWNNVIAAGQSMLVLDTMARGDSLFYLKLGQAYHATNQPFKAIETLSHAVAAFPTDARIYSLYTQYVRAEADTVIPRGLGLFPKNADLAALNAKELRARGKIAESLTATKLAVSLDSTMKQGQLTVAQLELELGRPDSALVALHKALSGGEDSALVAAFALSKGNGLYRAANGTKTSSDFNLALRFIAYADTVKSSLQSKFLMGATALGVAQSAVTEATKLKDKAESCRLAKWGADMVPVARAGLLAGQEAFADAAKQSLDFLNQLDPYVGQEVTVFCTDKPPA